MMHGERNVKSIVGLSVSTVCSEFSDLAFFFITAASLSNHELKQEDLNSCS